MSGRITLKTNLSQLFEQFSAEQVEPQIEWLPRFNIAPTQGVVVVRQSPHSNKTELAVLRWGQIPF